MFLTGHGVDMKLYLFLIGLNLLVFVISSQAAIITTALSIYLLRQSMVRGKRLVKAYLFMISLPSGMSVSEANEKVRNASQEYLEMMIPSARNFVDTFYNGSQMALINAAISQGMEGGSRMDKSYANAKARKDEVRDTDITANKDNVTKAQNEFAQFAKITHQSFAALRDGKGHEMDNDDRLFFMRYLVEALEMALNKYGIEKSLIEGLSASYLSGMVSISEDEAKGILAGFKMPPIRDPVTNEVLDEYFGAGKRAYQEWLDVGEASAVSNAESLWRKCYQLHNTRKQLSSIGFATAS